MPRFDAGASEHPGGVLAYRPQLDGLRALAALAVLVQHSMPVPGMNIGLAGVQLFFVLSGFLITGILLRERAAIDGGAPLTQVLRVFYTRRALRIFPLYYGVILLSLAVGIRGELASLPWHLTYTTNFPIALGGFDTTSVIYGHFWSLAVEEQFYLIWPAIVLLLPSRTLNGTLCALVAVGAVTRLATVLAFPGIEPRVLMPACIDALALGGLVALYQYQRRPLRMLSWSAVSAYATAAVALQLIRSVYGRLYTPWIVFEGLLQALVFAAVVNAASLNRLAVVGSLLRHSIIRYIGMISYGLYVYQGVVFIVGKKLGLQYPSYQSWGALAAIIGVTIPVASVSWFLFEKPINDLKRLVPYYRPKRATAPTG